MTDNDHGVRVVDHDPEGLQATCLRRYGVTITDNERTTTEVGMAERRESAERIADAIRKAIEDARAREHKARIAYQDLVYHAMIMLDSVLGGRCDTVLFKGRCDKVVATLDAAQNEATYIEGVARNQAFDEAIAEVQPGLSLRALRGSIEQLKERDDGDK